MSLGESSSSPRLQLCYWFYWWVHLISSQGKAKGIGVAMKDDGVNVSCGGLNLRQLGVAVAHCKLDPLVANLMKVSCSQEIYWWILTGIVLDLDWYALMEKGRDSPDIPMGMLSAVHLKKCEEILLKFVEELRSAADSDGKKYDFSNMWFTMMHSTQPFTIRGFQELADHVVAAYETVTDINVASGFIGDMNEATIDHPLFVRKTSADLLLLWTKNLSTR